MIYPSLHLVPCVDVDFVMVRSYAKITIISAIIRMIACKTSMSISELRLNCQSRLYICINSAMMYLHVVITIAVDY